MMGLKKAFAICAVMMSLCACDNSPPTIDNDERSFGDATAGDTEADSSSAQQTDGTSDNTAVSGTQSDDTIDWLTPSTPDLSTADGLCRFMASAGMNTIHAFGAFYSCSDRDELRFPDEDPAFSDELEDVLDETCQETTELYDLAQHLLDSELVQVDWAVVISCVEKYRAAMRGKPSSVLAAMFSADDDSDGLEEMISLVGLTEQETEECLSPHGLGQLGDACRVGLECEAGLFCALDEPGQVQAQCWPAGDVGDYCSSDDFTGHLRPCDDGLYCSAQHSCEVQALEGETCELYNDDSCQEGSFCEGDELPVCVVGKEQGESCDWETPCHESLYCDQPPEYEMGTCQPRLAAGASCESNSDCVDGLKCIFEMCSEPVRTGEPCEGFGDCASPCANCRLNAAGNEGVCLIRSIESESCNGQNQCAFGLYCTEDLVCAPQSKEGEACTPPVDYDQPCANSANCVDGFCEFLASEGESCQYNSSCEQGLACSQPSGDGMGVCVVEPEAGEPCAQHGRCALEAYCGQSDICLSKKAAGEECDDDEQCLGLCFIDTCTPANVGGCYFEKQMFPTLIMFGAFFWIPRRRRRA